MKKTLSTNQGMTLVEVIITIAVFGMVGAVVTVILINTLRGSTKASVLAVVRSNGQFALEQMTRTIRLATDLSTPSLPCSPASDGTSPTPVPSITVTDINGQTVS